jgi:hypothetical protein
LIQASAAGDTIDALPSRGSFAVPQPTTAATLVFLAGLFVTSVSLSGDTASAVARHAAIGCGVSLAFSLWVEGKNGIQNLLRADLVAMFALYFLLFFEFLFPQSRFDELVPYPDAVLPSVRLCLLAFAGIAVGRHCLPRHLRKWEFARTDLSPRAMLVIFWISLAVGYFHMLLAVDFNPVAMVDQFMGPRFAVPWGREQFGDARALLFEVGAMLYLVPPLAGIILGRRKLYSRTMLLLVLLALLFTLFYGFCTGTRNIIGSYLITFLAAYIYASKPSRRQLLIVTTIVFAILFLATYYEIRFRDVGLKNYLRGEDVPSEEDEEMTLYVDYNLYTVGALMNIFPRRVPYIGWDSPLWLLARPIPRALWPGKPDGTKVSIENILGLEGLTIAATFVGESYAAGGLIAVIIASVLVGMLAQWWTRKAFSPESGFGILIYGSGFFAVVITMRSMYWLPVAILPTLAAIVLGQFLREHRVTNSSLLARQPR